MKFGKQEMLSFELSQAGGLPFRFESMLHSYPVGCPVPAFSWLGRRGSLSHFYQREAGKSPTVETIVERKQPIAAPQSMSADQEVGQNAARPGGMFLSATDRILLKGPSGGAPSGFLQIPLDGDTCVLKK